jgi:hypothetical protein
MDFSLISQINCWAVVASVAVFFFLGALWFSVLFAKAWVHELKLHNVTIKEPSTNKLLMNMGLTLANNSIIVCTVACLVAMTGSSTFASGLSLGLMVGCGFIATAIGGVFIWESRSLKLFLIDSGYQIVGTTIAAVILSVWR